MEAMIEIINKVTATHSGRIIQYRRDGFSFK
ncbi:uncharacterized protein METZ01_LOCUS76027 [marine metagenome]|uniref:Uncharacterized protein n=1 Tax=marine metagenome TaxID=408172 RepID=A0A381U9C5_9ZZZZ